MRGRLWLQVLVAMALGIATGVLLGPSVGLVRPALATVIGSWLALPGQLFLGLVQMIVIPLVFASVIRGLAATEGVEQLRRLGSRVVLFFVLMTALGIGIGITVGHLVQPGRFVDSEALLATLPEDSGGPRADTPAPPGLAELPERLVMLLPNNPLSSAVSGEMLQIVMFAVIVGIALVLMAPDKARPLLEVLGSLQEVCMTVIATATASDGEMAERIARHRADRGQRWQTVEAPTDITGALGGLPTDAAVCVIDCLTLWLTNMMLDGRDIAAETDALAAALEARTLPVVLVSNEVGLGIVPEHELARRFRDEAGRLHQRLAAMADRVILMTAGLPLQVKPPPGA